MRLYIDFQSYFAVKSISSMLTSKNKTLAKNYSKPAE